MIEFTFMIAIEQERFLNLSGQFFPKPDPNTSNVFWTPHRQQLAQETIKAINQEFEPVSQEFGIPSLKFREDQISFVSRGKMVKNTARAQHDGSGAIKFCHELLDSDDSFLRDCTHEYLHNISLRLLFQKDGDGKFHWRRDGIQISPKSLRGKVQEDDGLFHDYNEGVIQITTAKILQKYFSLEDPMNWQGELVWLICFNIAAANSWWISTDDVIRVFQKATFGRGRFLELGKVMEKTYGCGGFRTLDRLLKKIPPKTVILDGENVSYPDFDSCEGQSLMDFITLPYHSRT